MASLVLPPPFVRQMQALLGEEWPMLEAALQAPPPVSIRFNPQKTLDIGLLDVGQLDGVLHQFPIPNSPIQPIQPLQPIPWHPHGFYLSKRPVFTLDPAFHAGAYYVQEASSMVLYEVLRQTVDFSKKLKILDLCASPGGKSTLASPPASLQMERGASDSTPGGGWGGLLIANETIRPRTAPLRENLERWGSPGVAITSAEVEAFAEMEGWFDVVLADAPCSGEGLFRKDPDAVREWSLPQIEFCAARQRRILAAAVRGLAPGGVLIYSTCTFNSAENDGNAAWLAKTFDLLPIALEIPPEWGIAQTDFGCQFYPHRLQGEGFYIAVFRKKEGEAKKHALPAVFRNLKPLPKNLVPQAAMWLSPEAEARLFQTPTGSVLALPAALGGEYLLLDRFLKTKWFGTAIGEFKGRDFVPSHALALSQWASADLPAVDLGREQALQFLKKETFELPAGTARGWALARYGGLNLGWMKILPSRLNNYLPQDRRIRMAVPSF